MFPNNNMEFMAGEHRRDLRQEAEQMRLIKAAGVPQPHYWEVVRNILNWLGDHLVQWGAHLQGYGTATSIQLTPTEAIETGYSQY